MAGAGKGPLKGLRAIDVSTVIAGGITSSMLADFGADVIKVEHPKYGDSSRDFAPKKNNVSLMHKVAGRNKRSVTLNLSMPAGQDLFRRMIKNTDILIENFRAGTMEKWGIGWEDLKKINPRLVMLRISGFGQAGPYSKMPGFGMVAEAMSGVAHRTGYPDGPPVFSSVPLADCTTGLFGAFSTMFAIYNRDHGSGSGEMIDLALFEPLFRLMEDQVIAYDQLGLNYGRIGIRSTTSAPRGVFPTRDGDWVVISAVTDATAMRLMRTVGGEAMEKDPRFRTNALRMENIEALESAIRQWIGERTQDQVLETFRAQDVVASGVYDIKKIFSDMQYQFRNNIVTVEDPDLGPVRVQEVLPRFANNPGAVAHLSVPLGSHTEEVFRDLGLAPEEIEKLRGEGVV